MLNMIDTQDKLKNFSEAQLIKEMQMPSGSAPQFMVLGEIERRKRMRADAQKREGLMKPTVAQEAVSAAGVPQQGIAQVAQAMAPKTDMAQNTGVPSVQTSKLPGQPNQPQRMADGGIMRLAPGGQMSGGSMSAIAALKVKYPYLYEEYKDSPSLAYIAQTMLEEAKTPEKTGLEELEAPRDYDLVKRAFSDPTRGEVIDQQKKDAKEFGEDYALAQRAAGLAAIRKAAKDPNSTLFAEGTPVEPVPYVSYDAFADGTAVNTGRYDFVDDLPDDADDFTTRNKTNAYDVADIYQPDPEYNPLAGDFYLDKNPTNAFDVARMYTGQPAVDPVAAERIRRRAKKQADEKAKRAYLAGEDFDEAGLPAVVGMINKAREFQESDTYTPPEQIYGDLTANSPLAGLKYEEASDEEFNVLSDRLARERAEAQRLKEEKALAERRMAENESPMSMAEYIRTQAEAKAREAANEVANAPDGISTRPKLRPKGLEKFVDPEAEDKKDAAKKIIEATGDNDKGKQTFKSTAENMNQDKWLALAQAGLTLMSTGDFGKAGSAGLAALRESKKADLAERKIAADEKLTDARIAAANKKTSGIKAPAAAALNFYQDQVKNAEDALANAETDVEKVAARKALTRAQAALRQLVDRYELSMGMFSVGGGSDGVTRLDLTSKAE